MSDIVLRVAMKAVIVDGGQVLILREGSKYDDGANRGRYHLPGGRVDAGENFEDSLRREVHEETGLEIELGTPIYVGEWRPVIRGRPHQIVATFIVCRPRGGQTVRLSGEHDRFVWIKPGDRAKYDLMPPYDQVIDRLAELTKRAVL